MDMAWPLWASASPSTNEVVVLGVPMAAPSPHLSTHVTREFFEGEAGRESIKDWGCTGQTAGDYTVVWPSQWDTAIPGQPIGTRKLDRA